MIYRAITIIMAMLIFASSLAANGVFLADCQERSCCCHGAAMAGDPGNSAKFRSVNKCCCNEAAGKSCSLTTMIPSEKIGWALSPNRADPSEPIFAHTYTIDDRSFLSAAAFATDLKDPVIHQASPPTYLILMSFLC